MTSKQTIAINGVVAKDAGENARSSSHKCDGIVAASIRFLIVFAVSVLPICMSGCQRGQPQSSEIETTVRSGSLGELTDLLRGGESMCGGKEGLALVAAAAELRRGKFDRSLHEIAKVDPKGRFRANCLWIAGESLFRSGNVGSALPLLSTLTTETPDHLPGRKCLAALYCDLGAMDYAERELKLVCDLDESDYRPRFLLGRICLDFEKFGEATAYFQKAYELSPDEARRSEVESLLAPAMCGDRQYETLLQRFSAANVDPVIRTCRAESLWGTGKSAEAQSLVREILADHPDLPGTLLLSARLEASAGKPDAAIVSLNRILQSDPHNVPARFQLAMAYKQIGDNASFDANMELKSQSQELLDRLVRLSREVIDKISPQSVYLEIADVCDQLEKKELAEQWRRVAIGIGGKP